MNSITNPSGNLADQPGAEGLTLAVFTRWLTEILNQPPWRAKADKWMDYVDGNQLDSEILQKQASVGIPPAIEPLIGPAVDAVVGLEAKTRTDWRLTPDSDIEGADEVAEALNFKLNQAERKSGADKACTDAFKPQYCVGIGWVEVARESDPFKFPYRCTAVHRNEIWWDMLDREPGLPKARYLIRRRWTDAAQVKLKFPKFAELVDASIGRWTEQYQLTLDGGSNTALATSFDEERGWTIEEQEWRDSEARRVCLFEVWYRKWEEVPVLKLPDGRVVEYNDKLASHVIAVAQGYAKPVKAVLARMYRSYWMGPHKLDDGPTPYKHQEFPYVQFIGKLEDRTGTPFGAVKGAMYLQDSVNSVIAKIRWGLSAMRTIRTKGAVDYSDEVFRQQVARPDADIVLDAEHMKNGGVFKVERDFQLNEQQYKMLGDSRLGIERAMGAPGAFQGQPGTATSGVQESTQIEQATQLLAGLMDNFKFARTKVGELLLSMIIEDMIGKPETVQIKGNGVRPDKTVQVNQPTQDPDTGVTYLTNDIERVRLKVAMNDVPSTPSFRTQQLAAMSEAFKAMPPQYQEVALPHLLSLMDVPNRDQLLEEIRAAKEQLTPDVVEQRIKAAVDAALQQSDHDIRRLELEKKYSPEKLQAEIQKIINDAVKAGAEGAFASMQAAAQLAANPAIAPVADAVMQSSGWRAPVPAGQDPNFPAPAAAIASPGMPEVRTNTSPQLPPVPQEASALTGVETARTNDNLPQAAT